jgi:alcohol dehydrogenase class IV
MQIPQILFELDTVAFALNNFIESHVSMAVRQPILLISDPKLADIYRPLIEVIEQAQNVQSIITFIEREPEADMIENIRNLINENNISIVIGVGGGSVMDTAKLAATLSASTYSLEEFLKNPQLPLKRKNSVILVPTLIGAGAELSSGVSLRLPSGKKSALAHPSLLADLVILDATLCAKAPRAIAFASAADAFSHALESYVSVRATVWTRRTSQNAMERIVESLNMIHNNEESYAGWENLIVATIEATVSLASAGGGIGHALAYAISDNIGLSHGSILARLVPRLINYYVEFGLIKGSLAQLLTSESILMSFCRNLSPFPICLDEIDIICTDAINNTRLIGNHPISVSIQQLRNLVLFDNTLTL